MAEFLNFKGDYKGLSTEKAEKNLSMYGENLFTDIRSRRLGIKETVLSPVFLLLTTAAVIYLAAQPADIPAAIGCAALALADVALKIPLCRYCNRRLYGRMMASEMKYRVIREERLELIAARYLVPDDIIILQAGETVPADAHILECTGLAVDECALTGAGGSVRKHAGADPGAKDLKASCLYAGSRIVSGGAVARIFATGEDTARVRRAGMENRPDPNYTEYERAARRIYLPVLLTGVILSALFLIISWLTSENPRPELLCLSAIGQVMCFVPASAGIFVRLYCIYGIKRIERKGAAVKSLKDIEKLNGLTALVIDKSTVVSPDLLEVAGIYSKNDALMTAVTALACARPGVLPTEQAFLLNVRLSGTDIGPLADEEPVLSFPYNENDRIGGNVYRTEDKYLVCVQGSVEKITGLCSMEPDGFYRAQQRAAVLAKRGLEVWASGYAILDAGEEPPRSLYTVSYRFMGLTAYMSATRDIIPLAVQGCRRSGVKPVLVSSDSAETAVAMGKKLGISPDGMITGEMLREAERSGKTPDFSKAEIFSDITMAQKPAIIDGLRNSGETVACIGFDDSQYDTVIRSDLGITSLDSTTGSLYEACGLVMSDDSFGGIVEVFKEARQLHRNIKKLMSVLLVALITTSLTALADMIFRTGAVTPMFAGIISVLVIPVCAVCFIDNTAEMRAEMRPSAFLGRKGAGSGFYLSRLLSGGVTGLVSAVFMTVCSGIMTSGQTAAASLILITTALCTYTLFISGGRKGIFALIKSGSVNIRRALCCLICIVLIILICAAGVVNNALGLEFPGINTVIIAVVLGIACSGWHELRKYF